MKKYALFIPAVCLIIACGQSSEPAGLDAENLEKSLQEALINATEGAVIQLPEGTYNFQRSLSLDGINNVHIKGAGKDKTILSFKGQIEGAEGLLVKAVDKITLEGFTVRDSKGDAIKVTDSKNVVMRDLHTTWTGGALETNGGYGLYPVSCTGVLMEGCVASFASDAGIYVGQSTDIIVRNCEAHHNVAGIEIENCIKANVYDNKAHDNTGGILIFDMPNLPQANGSDIRIHDNESINNNFKNFSPPGGVVHIVPPGTGMIILAASNIEIFNNKIENHNTVGITAVSWMFTQRPMKEGTAYNPFCSGLNIHDNQIKRAEAMTDTTTNFGKLCTALFEGQPQDIIIDGIFNPANMNEDGTPKPEHWFCFKNNGEALRFVNLNAYKGSEPAQLAANMDRKAELFDCSLPAIEL